MAIGLPGAWAVSAGTRKAPMMPTRHSAAARPLSDHTAAEGDSAAACRPTASSAWARRRWSVQAARQVPMRMAATVTAASAALPRARRPSSTSSGITASLAGPKKVLAMASRAMAASMTPGLAMA